MNVKCVVNYTNNIKYICVMYKRILIYFKILIISVMN